MKKISLVAIMAIAAISGVINYSHQTVQQDLNTLALTNIDALARGEGGTRIKCYTSLVYEDGASVVDCTTCESVENKSDAWYNIHDYCYTN